MHRFVCVLAAIGVMTAPAMAQTALPAAALAWEAAPLPDVKPVQIVLTPELIENFLAVLPEILSLARDLDREQGRNTATKLANEDLAFLLVPYLFDPEIEKQINGRLAPFGFESYPAWANAAHSVALAAEAADFTGAVDLGSQEQAARREIEADMKLSASEKTKALEELESQFAALAEFEPLPGNRQAVAPYLERLKAATGG